MKKYFLIFYLLFSATLLAQSSVIGKWKTIDDATGKAMSIVEIFEKSGRIYGRVIEIIEPKHKHFKCDKCEGDDNGKPILGLLVIKGLYPDGHEYNGGKVLDPKSGKLYKCYINLENDDKLKVRGYIGISLFGRTQYWHHVK